MPAPSSSRFKDFEERYETHRGREEAERARDPAGLLREGAADRRGDRDPDRAARRFPASAPPGGFEFWIQDTGAGDPVALDAVMQDFLKKARERPELTGARHDLFARTRSSCARTSTATRRTLLGIPIQDVYSAIQAQFGSLTVSQYNQFSRRVVGDRAVRRAVPAESRRT